MERFGLCDLGFSYKRLLVLPSGREVVLTTLPLEEELAVSGREVGVDRLDVLEASAGRTSGGVLPSLVVMPFPAEYSCGRLGFALTGE